MNTSLQSLEPQWSPRSSPSNGVMQRACDCGNQRSLQRSTQASEFGRNRGGAPPIVHDVLRSPGRSLDAATRSFMEPRFGHDFSGVQVHTDARAAESARAVNAAAYTVGPHVVFGHGRYAPQTSAGQRLLAHELTHTIQQGGNASPATGTLEVGEPNDSYEQEAESVTDKVLAAPTDSAAGGESQPLRVSNASPRVGPVRLARQEEVAFNDAPNPEQPIPQDGGATPMAVGPDCSRSRGYGQSMPWPNTAFRGERGFVYIPEDGYPGPGGLLVTGNSVSIRITARWEEQIPDPADRPSDQRSRRADRPEYYLSFNGWADDCDRDGTGRSASSLRSGNLSIGTEHIVRFRSVTPGRYGLQINPSTASAEPNRVLTGTCEIT